MSPEDQATAGPVCRELPNALPQGLGLADTGPSTSVASPTSEPVLSLKTLADVGDFFAGVGAVLAVLIAYHQLKRWRYEQLAKRRGDVAAEALLALNDACDACHDWAVEICDQAGVALANLGEYTQGEINQRLEIAFESGKATAEGPLRAVRQGIVKALPHLVGIESAPLVEVMIIRDKIVLAFNHAMVRMRHGGSSEIALTELQDVLTAAARECDALQQEGSLTLTRVARLEDLKRRSTCVRLVRLARRIGRPPRDL